ncbi:hypothetical protein SteCoe_18144 [Stentor coeruleus]|uniref:Uncharacterized protein n=1 Tax=Stentor coeruleus TaxID=5963 RepID=A0A1R2BX84_9CILI|nr:hypothetical protein SteCoe_18144 [Stentor coeruleus]
MNANSTAHSTQVSIYDSIEHLHLSTSTILSKCDKKLSKHLSRVFQQWERTLNHLISEKQVKDAEFSELKEKYIHNKNTELKLRIKLTQKKSKESEMIKEIQAIKDHLEEGKEMWGKQIKKIEEVMQEQERTKQKIEALYQQRLSEIDSELDDIIHIHKKKLEHSQNLKEILPALFSQEELQEEKKIALGEISQRKIYNIDLKKPDAEPIYDINSDNSNPSFAYDIFDDLTGTQKIVFERLLELRKKLYKFKHDDTICSESSSEILPCDLKSISKKYSSKIFENVLSKTAELKKKTSKSELILMNTGIIFGMKGSKRYREGLIKLLKSDKLSISERENIVYNLIHGDIKDKAKLKTVDIEELVKQENWGDMSSIYGENKEIELSHNSSHGFSKESLDLSKGFLGLKDCDKGLKESQQEKDFLNELDRAFSKPSEDFEHVFFESKPNEESKKPLFIKETSDKNQEISEIDLSKIQENSSMSIIKDFSQNISLCSKRRMSDESHKENSILEVDDAVSIVSSRKKFSMDQREPSSSSIFPPKTNLFFLPENPRPRSNPRITLKPEENFRSRDTSLEESNNLSFHKIPVKALPDTIRKPISMKNKLPIIPRPPPEAKKIQVKSFRGRSLQPIQTPNTRVVHSPPSRKLSPADKKTGSPGAVLKFRMKRYKEIPVSAIRSTKGNQSSNKSANPRKTNL